MGRLKDGTFFRKWVPPLPLDERWTAPSDPSILAVRDRWVGLRSSLIESDGLDSAIRRLVAFWDERGLIPRPIKDDVSSDATLLLKVAVDVAMGASAKNQGQLNESLLPETTRDQVAELLEKPLRHDSDLMPMEISALHSLVSGNKAPIDRWGNPQVNYAGRNPTPFRMKPIYVMGTDLVLKEGCPPKQIVAELLKVIETNKRARLAGVPAVLRAAWVLYAISIVHPFYDGNGRVARMLASMILIRGGRLPFNMPPRAHQMMFGLMAEARNGKPEGLIALVAKCQIELMESAFAALA